MRLSLPEAFDRPADPKTPYEEKVGLADTDAHIDPFGRQIIVPASQTAVARRARLHELLHARFRPPYTPQKMIRRLKIRHEEAVQVVEDCKIHLLAQYFAPTAAAHIQATAGCAPPIYYTRSPDRNAERCERGKDAIPHFTEPEYSRLMELLDSTAGRRFLGTEVIKDVFGFAFTGDLDASVALVMMVHSGDKAFGALLGSFYRATALLEKRFRDDAEKIISQGDDLPRIERRCNVLAGHMMQELDALMSAFDQMLETAAPGNHRGKTPEHEGDNSGGPGWQRMKTIPLSAEHGPIVDTAARLYAYRPAFTGVRLGSPSRRYVDGRIVSRRRPEKGLSLLIDGSASMGWDDESFDALLARAPASRIAIYSAEQDFTSESTGVLVILADGSRRYRQPFGVWDRMRPGGGNGVDGSALAWLSRQPGPRYWLSDGEITGDGTIQNHRLAENAERLMRSARITRLDASNNEMVMMASSGIIAADHRPISWRQIIRRSAGHHK